jgi:N4-gp56 family major capsid protein
MNTLYGDISPRTAAFVVVQLLTRGMPYLLLEQFGSSKPLPSGKSLSMKFRRYLSLPLATTPLSEGVTPVSKKLSSEDITMTLSQYGDVVEITDVILDAHEDPILQETETLLGEQAAKTIETMRYYILRAGTNVQYANGALRTSVNTAINTTMQRKITRNFKRQNAEKITTKVSSTPSFNTESVLPAFIAIGHTDLEADIRGMTNFTDVKDYGSTPAYTCEVGAVDDVRYLLSSIYGPWADAGAAKGAMISTSAVLADVYPVLYLARNAYAISALKGEFAITPIVINPAPSKTDPLGQRGSVGWKTMQGVVILNDMWMCRGEVACTE